MAYNVNLDPLAPVFKIYEGVDFSGKAPKYSWVGSSHELFKNPGCFADVVQRHLAHALDDRPSVKVVTLYNEEPSVFVVPCTMRDILTQPFTPRRVT